MLHYFTIAIIVLNDSTICNYSFKLPRRHLHTTDTLEDGRMAKRNSPVVVNAVHEGPLIKLTYYHYNE